MLPVVSLRAKTDGDGVVTPRKHHLSLSLSLSLLLSLSLSVCICDVTEDALFLSLSESKFTLPVTLSYEVFSILSEISSCRYTL